MNGVNYLSGVLSISTEGLSPTCNLIDFLLNEKRTECNAFLIKIWTSANGANLRKNWEDFRRPFFDKVRDPFHVGVLS